MENLRFELLARGLISTETCKSKEAGDMVTEIQFRLATDETIWKRLIEALEKCNKPLVKDLLKELEIEMAQERLPIDGITARKFEKKAK